MDSSLVLGTSATPITLLTTNDYEHWLGEQTPYIQNVLKQSAFKGKGHALLFDDQGYVKTVVFVCDDPAAFFLAADLPNQLPSGTYQLDLTHTQDENLQDESTVLNRFAVSWGLAAYRFNRYKQGDNEPAVLAVRDSQTLDEIRTFVRAISLTRDLVNTPANDMMPEHLSAAAQALAEEYGASIEEIVGEELLTANYPMIHAVGRASAHAPRLIDLRWGNDADPKITLVGKGVCFDSGGLNIKPGNYMRLMKKDMGGAAHVLGLAQIIMGMNLPVRLRVLIPAVENAVAGNAFRPGDVLPTRQGLSVEIDNTDAEGRLVLCDALSEADRESPDAIIDFATLTGACRVALGTELPGMFCNDDDLAHAVFRSGQRTGDPVWQLPLHTDYQEMLKSDVADTVNSAASPYAGAITAALFLQLFVSPKTAWMHFDVMAWNLRGRPGRPVGGEAFGLRAVFDALQARYGR